MAGTWSLFLLPNIGDIHQPWIRLSVAGVGALVMAGVGWVLWRLGVSGLLQISGFRGATPNTRSVMIRYRLVQPLR